MQDCESELKERAVDSGASFIVSFASYVHGSWLSRTCEDSLFGESIAFSETWPTSGMTRSGRAYERPTWVPRIAELASSSWPTPDASVFQEGETPETWLKRREVLKANGYNGNGMGTPLAMA